MVKDPRSPGAAEIFKRMTEPSNVNRQGSIGERFDCACGGHGDAASLGAFDRRDGDENLVAAAECQGVLERPLLGDVRMGIAFTGLLLVALQGEILDLHLVVGLGRDRADEEPFVVAEELMKETMTDKGFHGAGADEPAETAADLEFAAPGLEHL